MAHNRLLGHERSNKQNKPNLFEQQLSRWEDIRIQVSDLAGIATQFAKFIEINNKLLVEVIKKNSKKIEIKGHKINVGPLITTTKRLAFLATNFGPGIAANIIQLAANSRAVSIGKESPYPDTSNWHNPENILMLSPHLIAIQLELANRLIDIGDKFRYLQEFIGFLLSERLGLENYRYKYFLSKLARRIVGLINTDFFTEKHSAQGKKLAENICHYCISILNNPNTQYCDKCGANLGAKKDRNFRNIKQASKQTINKICPNCLSIRRREHECDNCSSYSERIDYPDREFRFGKIIACVLLSDRVRSINVHKFDIDNWFDYRKIFTGFERQKVNNSLGALLTSIGDAYFLDETGLTKMISMANATNENSQYYLDRHDYEIRKYIEDFSFLLLKVVFPILVVWLFHANIPEISSNGAVEFAKSFLELYPKYILYFTIGTIGGSLGVHFLRAFTKPVFDIVADSLEKSKYEKKSV
jgi:hypothetical protein